MSGHEAVRVLVVDDQEIYRETARFVLEMTEGFELIGMAESGEDALVQADELHPDLVLMDINMPGIDGLEATRRVVDRVPGTGVIVFSTHSADDYEALALEAGAIGFITKAELAPDTLEATWRSGVDSTTSDNTC